MNCCSVDGFAAKGIYGTLKVKTGFRVPPKGSDELGIEQPWMLSDGQRSPGCEGIEAI